MYLTNITGNIPLKEVTPNKIVFSTPGNQTLLVPQGCKRLRVKLWGAGGGSGYSDSGVPGGEGAAGDFINGEISVTPGEELTIYVGGGGGGGTIASAGFGGINGGGAGGNPDGGVAGGGGGGGGFSGIFRKNNTVPYIIAAGGGGGGAGDSDTTLLAGGAGGNGNYPIGRPGKTGITPTTISFDERLSFIYQGAGIGEDITKVSQINDLTGTRISGVTSTLDPTTIANSISQPLDRFGIIFTGKFFNPGNTDMFYFTTTSDDGSVLLINDQVVINNDGVHASITVSGFAEISSGLNDIEILYFERTGNQVLSSTVRSSSQSTYSGLLASGFVALTETDFNINLFGPTGGNSITNTGGIALPGLNQVIQPTNGSFLQGGSGGTGINNNRGGGGGGGAGLYGGAGGRAADSSAEAGTGGAGGGSFYNTETLLVSERGRGKFAPAIADIDYITGIAAGGSAAALNNNGISGGDGLVVIEFLMG